MVYSLLPVFLFVCPALFILKTVNLSLSSSRSSLLCALWQKPRPERNSKWCASVHSPYFVLFVFFKFFCFVCVFPTARKSPLSIPPYPTIFLFWSSAGSPRVARVCAAQKSCLPLPSTTLKSCLPPSMRISTPPSAVHLCTPPRAVSSDFDALGEIPISTPPSNSRTKTR